ncbi:MAG: cation transporter [Spirochaetota bacterium]
MAGAYAGSIALFGFGLDSFVESLSGLIMIWRFNKHGTLSEDEEMEVEEKVLHLVGYTFFILAFYIIYESVTKLYYSQIPDVSGIGILIACISLVIMPVVYYKKRRLPNRY